MTTFNDWRTLLAKGYDGPDGPYAANTADAILATRITWMCPNCKGSGTRPCENCDEDCSDDPCKIDGCLYSPTQCTHRHAPTIADLLRWGENVARHDSPLTVLHAMDGTPVPDKYDMTGRDIEVLTNAAIAALRTEADQ